MMSPIPEPACPVGIITISDRASKGVYEDLSGPALKAAAERYGWKVSASAVVADEKQDIQGAIREQIARGCRLILTTGGTGVAPRDITPEAVRELASRELPGFGETMRRESLKTTANALLSRSLAAVIDRTLVICLPGKPAGAVECLGFVAGAVPHCLDLLEGLPEDPQKGWWVGRDSNPGPTA
jgi:molybdopterin adenylyltransferase